MSLIVKPPSWAYCSTNMPGTIQTALDLGVNFTAGASNADGSAVTLLSALAHDVEYLIIGIEGCNASGAASDALMDILVDPAGGTSWSSLIDDLLIGCTPQGGALTAATPMYYHFPIWIPAGASLGVRGRTRRTSTIISPSVTVMAFGGNANPGSWWCGRKVESIGITAATSQGVSHTPGSSGAYSSWADFGSTLSAKCGALQFAMQGDNNAAMTSVAYYVEYGVGGQRIGPTYFQMATTAETIFRHQNSLIFCELPTGTQLQARALCSGVAQSIQVAAYAVI